MKIRLITAFFCVRNIWMIAVYRGKMKQVRSVVLQENFVVHASQVVNFAIENSRFVVIISPIQFKQLTHCRSKNVILKQNVHHSRVIRNNNITK